MKLLDLIAILGIFFSLYGSFYTLRSILQSPIDSIVKRHIMFPGYNGDAIRSEVEQAMWTKYGISFVVLGGVTQLIGVFCNWQMVVRPIIIFLILLIVLIILTITAFLFKKRIAHEEKNALNIAKEILSQN